jgi:hypothetical protein
MSAFPWHIYRIPPSPTNGPNPVKVRNQGGFLGVLAFIDALNIWDIVKPFSRAIRWLFVGLRHRETGPSYSIVPNSDDDGNVVSGFTTRQNEARGYFKLSGVDRD